MTKVLTIIVIAELIIAIATLIRVTVAAFEDVFEENEELRTYNEKLLNSDIEKHNKIVELTAQIKKQNADILTLKDLSERQRLQIAD